MLVITAAVHPGGNPDPAAVTPLARIEIENTGDTLADGRTVYSARHDGRRETVRHQVGHGWLALARKALAELDDHALHDDPDTLNGLLRDLEDTQTAVLAQVKAERDAALTHVQGLTALFGGMCSAVEDAEAAGESVDMARIYGILAQLKRQS